VERNRRKVFTGTVVSEKENKTITVSMVTHLRHPLYGKRIDVTRKLTVHDEKNEAKTGDIVRVMESRPLSKIKRFTLLEIVQRADII
jgi:small subunit ribosomal protein S17